MKKFIPIVLILFFGVEKNSAQFCDISDQTVSSSVDTSCYSEDVTIKLASSQSGVNYYVRDNANDTVVAGPVPGTGDSIIFNTGPLTATKTYHVYASAADNSVLDLDNVDDRVDIDPVIPLTGSFSVMGWIKTTNATSGKILTWSAASGISLYVSFRVHFGKLSYYSKNTNANTSNVTSNITVNNGEWHHFAFTKNGATDSVSVYIDGTLDVTMHAPVLYSPFANTSIGGAYLNNSYQGYLDGTIDELSIWDTVLTSAQIQNAKSVGLTGTEPSLQAYYDFEEDSGSLVTDISTNSYNGTLVNMDTINDWMAVSCNKVLSDTVTIDVLSDIDVTIDTTSLPALTANQTGANYQWLNCDNANSPVAGETNQNFTVTSSGNYAVEISVGHCVDTSACENVTVTGTEEINTNIVYIYPNPTNGTLTIDVSPDAEIVNYSITTIDGRIVFRGKFSQNFVKVDLSNERKGVYFLTLESSNTNKVYKLIKY